MQAKIGNFKKTGQRRIHIKIDDFDTINLTETCALLILPLLLEYKETYECIPDSAMSDISGQLCFDFYDGYEHPFDIKPVIRWDDLLDKMIWSFYQLSTKSGIEMYQHGKISLEEKRSKDGVFYYERNTSQYWFDSVGYDEYVRRIQEGIDLFAKHFQELLTI